MPKLQPISEQTLRVVSNPSGKLKPVDTPLVVSGPKYTPPVPQAPPRSLLDNIKSFGHSAADVLIRGKGIPSAADAINNFSSSASRSFINTLFQPGIAGGDKGFNQQVQNAGGAKAFNQQKAQEFNTGGRTDTASTLGMTAGSAAPFFIPGGGAAAVGVQAGNQLGNISSQTGIGNNVGDSLRVVGNAGLNLAPGIPLRGVTGGLGAGGKFIANNAIRGAENVVRGQGVNLIETGGLDPSQIPNQFGVGFGLGVVLNPGETAAAGKSLRGKEPKPIREAAPVTQAVQQNPVPEIPKVIQETQSVSSPSTASYIKEQVSRQNAARETENPTGIRSRLVELQKKLKSGFVDSQSAIEDTLSNAEKKGGFSVVPSNDIRLQQAAVRRSDQLATSFIHDNGLADVIKDAPDLDELNQYLIARHASDVEKAGFTTGRDSQKDAQLVSELGPTYEPLAQKVTEYSNKALDYAVESGLVSRETATALKEKYPNYVPIDRIFSEGEQELMRPPSGTGKSAMASQGSQNAVRKLQGSEREISNPIETLLSRTQEIFQQGERNKSAQMLASYKDLPDNPFNITPLRTAENVAKRIDLYEQAGELKPVQRKLQRLLITRGKWQRNLESSINTLNKKGLYLSLKGGEQKATPKIQSEVTVKQSKPGGFTETDTGDRFFVQTGKTKTSVSQRDAVSSNRQIKQLVNNLVNLPRSEIEALKSKIATRENRLGGVLDQIADMSDSLEAVKSKRNELFDEARLLKDAETRGLSTFSTMKDGIKEVYATEPEIAAAAKNMNKQQLGLVGQILSGATRVFKLGTTGLRPSFVVANLAKDQVTAVINSDKALNTSVANPLVFLKGFSEAIGKGDLFQEMQRAAGGGTSLDLYRNSAPETVAKLRSKSDKASSILYTVTHPKELFRAAEDAVNVTEQATRIQQYAGTKQALLAEGRTERDATLLAAKAARENTVDFYKSGSYGQVLNAVIPYLNAGIQGSRTLITTLRRNPSGAAAKMALTVFSPIAMATVWNLSDPDRKAAYDDIQDYEKEGNLIIVPPNPTKDEKTGKWNIIKVPLSQEVANLGSIVRRGIEGAHEADPLTIGEVADNLFQAGTSLSTSPRQTLSSITPQALKAPIEAASNTNLFTGNKIIPDSLKNLPPEMQYKESTSPYAKKIGATLGVSPLVVGNTVKEIFGGLGSDILDQKPIIGSVAERFNQAAGGREEDKQFDAIDKSVQQGAVTSSAKKKSLQEAAKQFSGASTSQKKAIIQGLKASGALTSANLGTFKTMVTDSLTPDTEKLTSSERYLKSQSTDVRAQYIRSEIKKLPKGPERTRYLQGLVKKKLVTPDVLNKIRNPQLISTYGQET